MAETEAGWPVSLRPRVQEINAEYWATRERLTERVAVAQLAMALAIEEKRRDEAQQERAAGGELEVERLARALSVAGFPYPEDPPFFMETAKRIIREYRALASPDAAPLQIEDDERDPDARGDIDPTTWQPPTALRPASPESHDDD